MTKTLTSADVVDAFERVAKERAERNPFWAADYASITAHPPQGEDDHMVRVWAGHESSRLDLVLLTAEQVSEELRVTMNEHFDKPGQVTFHWMAR